MSSYEGNARKSLLHLFLNGENTYALAA